MSIIEDFRTGQAHFDAQITDAGSEQTPRSQNVPDTHDMPAAGPQLPDGQKMSDTPCRYAVGNQPAGSQSHCDTQGSLAASTQLPDGHVVTDTHEQRAVGDQLPPAAKITPMPSDAARLVDLSLALAAETVDELEAARIAAENRLRQMTRSTTDKDGEVRGLGLPDSHPAVVAQQQIVDGLANLEKIAVKRLEKAMRVHALGPWVKAQRGVGDKQAARLLAAVGDPYWNTLHDRPRTVSELWAYCGLHTLPASQGVVDTHTPLAGGIKPGNPDQSIVDAQTDRVWVAARRRKGQRANWNTTAKSRSRLIAESCLKAGGPWAEVYYQRKAATEGRLHNTPCAQCGKAKQPAPTGSPWRDGHRHADALRIVSKELLKDLWRTARDIHHTEAAA